MKASVRIALTAAALIVAAVAAPPTSVGKNIYKERAAAAQGRLWALVSVGDSAYDDGNYAEAAAWYEKAMAAGNPDRALRLGDMYAKGLGVPVDMARARALWTNASGALLRKADRERWSAFLLATLYRDGKGTAVDVEQAKHWFERAAELGHEQARTELAALYIREGAADQAIAQLQEGIKEKNSDAQNRLGDLYYDGKLVPQDFAKALSMYEAGVAMGAYTKLPRIGDMYEAGQGTKPDQRRAAEYWKQAVEKLTVAAPKSTYARSLLGMLYLDGKGVAADFGKAVGLLQSAAEAGDLSARYKLAFIDGSRSDARSKALAKEWSVKLADSDSWILERAGDVLAKSGTPADKAASNIYWRRAADFYRGVAEDNPKAAFQLGMMYREAKGVPANLAETIRWLTIAGRAKNERALKTLGDIYYDGKQTEPDYGQALGWYLAADKAGNVWCLERIGDIYASGQGVDKNPAAAEAYWIRAAAAYEKVASSNDWAAFSLGRLYAKGRGVAKDDERARYWLEASRRGGKTWAESELAALDRGGR
jgi:uncharacterized protein